MPQPIATFLAFQKDGKQAVEFYASIFRDASIDHITMRPDSDQLLHAGFRLNGTDFMAIDVVEHPDFTFTNAVSLFVSCENQTEVDYYWEAFLSNGGEELACGWLKDQFGVRWQIIPTRLMELISDPDPERSGYAMQAMLQMQKIVIADLEETS